jgi:hypothetical protein
MFACPSGRKRDVGDESAFGADKKEYAYFLLKICSDLAAVASK